jgi:hypothetical protein
MKHLKLTNGEEIKIKSYFIRNQQVVLDFDAATLYGVPLESLHKAIAKNPVRFPPDFAFLLTESEWNDLKSQTELSVWTSQKKPPISFTEGGLAMLSDVLKSKQAVEISIAIINAIFSVIYPPEPS